MAEQLMRCLSRCRGDSEHKGLEFSEEAREITVLEARKSSDEIKWLSQDLHINSIVSVKGDKTCRDSAPKVACIHLCKTASSNKPAQVSLDITEQDWITLLETFNLTEVRARAHTNPSTFGVCPRVQGGKIVGYTSSLYVSRLIGFYSTYDIDGCANTIFWASKKDLETFKLALAELTHLAHTPYGPFLALATTVLSFGDRRLIEWHRRIGAIEMRTGYHDWGTMVYAPAGGTWLDLQAKMSGALIMISSTERLIKLASIMIEDMRSEILFDHRLLPELLRGPAGSLATDMVCYESYIKAQLVFVENLRERARVQMTALLHLDLEYKAELSREVAVNALAIAEATKRDSTSMKILAAMTVLFLPGTFVASLLSSSMFRWRFSDNDDDDERAVVSSQFWIYWVVTVPLTLLVVAVSYHFSRDSVASLTGSNEQNRVTARSSLSSPMPPPPIPPPPPPPSQRTTSQHPPSVKIMFNHRKDRGFQSVLWEDATVYGKDFGADPARIHSSHSL